MRPQDKELFLAKSLIDPILVAAKKEVNKNGTNNKTNAYLKMVIKELKAVPFATYSVLRFSALFQKFGVLDKGLAQVDDNDIIIYLAGHPDNLHRLITFNNATEQKKGQKHPRTKEIVMIC